MIPRSLLVLALAAAPLLAQDADPAPSPVIVPAPEANHNAALRGITRVYLDVTTPEGARPEDSDLRGDLRDVIELELRRAGIMLMDGGLPDDASRSPALRLEVRFDRGAGRYAARLNLSVRDRVSVTRNGEVLLAEVWSVERGASSSIETGLSREIRLRVRDLTSDFITALRKPAR